MTVTITGHDRFSLRRSWRLLSLCVTAGVLFLPACESCGHFSILGYSTRPNYDPGIRTVYVPIFRNKTVGDTIRRGIEFDLTRAVIREIEAKTPYKVVSCPDGADTELKGTILSVTKGLLNINQENEVREAQTTIAVEIIWRDLRSGEVLSTPTPRPGLAAPGLIAGPQVPPGSAVPLGGSPDDDVPGAPVLPGASPLAGEMGIKPVLQPVPGGQIQSVDRYIPELGGSMTTALKGNVDRLAIQIVSMMESPW